jgi:hypothetical protein
MAAPPGQQRKKDALDYSRFDAIVVSDESDDDAGSADGVDDEEDDEDEDDLDDDDDDDDDDEDCTDDEEPHSGLDDDGLEESDDQSPDEGEDPLLRGLSPTDASAGTGTAGTAQPQAPPAVCCACGRCGASGGPGGGGVCPLGSLPAGRAGKHGVGDAACGASPGEDAPQVDGEGDGSAEGTKPVAAGAPGGPPHVVLAAGQALPPLPPLGDERYDGELDGSGQRHGYGRYVWRNGAVYEGVVRAQRTRGGGPPLAVAH